MLTRRLALVLSAVLVGLPQALHAQAPVQAPSYRNPYGGWRPATAARRPLPVAPRSPVPSGLPRLPQDLRVAAAIQQKQTPFLGPWTQSYGQVWREYDILPYTVRVSSTSRPEQAIIDWILRETGPATWHGDKIAVLSADRSKLRVYHEPAVQSQVAQIVDRFVQGGASQVAFTMRVITVGDPDWRRKAYALLKPMPGSTHGPQAWLLEREDASLLRSDLAGRRDYRLHNTPYLLIHNGQPATVRWTAQRNYVRDVRMSGETWPGYQTQLGYVEEGMGLELVPLLTADRQYVDADLKVHLDQLESLHDVTIDVPTPYAPRQTTRIQVPQTAQRRVEERFRWPVAKVLLVSLGVAPPPTPTPPSPLPFLAPRRDEFLVFIEANPNTGSSLAGPAVGGTAPSSLETSQSAYRYRYRPRTAYQPYYRRY